MRRRALIGLIFGAVGVLLWRWSQRAATAQPLRTARASEKPPGPQASGAENGHLPTRAELYREAQVLDVRGRSKMSKAQLAEAVQARRSERVGV